MKCHHVIAINNLSFTIVIDDAFFGERLAIVAGDKAVGSLAIRRTTPQADTPADEESGCPACEQGKSRRSKTD